MSFKVALFVLCTAVACSDASKNGAEVASDEPKQQINSVSAEAATTRLDPSQVPADIRDLTALAEKWGIGDDVKRSEFQAAASSAEKAALKRALEGRNQRITQWIDSFPGGSAMSPEAAAFMYMQLGLDEMGLWTE